MLQSSAPGPDGIDYTLQTGSSFYDGAFAFGKKLLPLGKEIFQLAETYATRSFVTGGIIVGGLKEGVPGAIKGGVTSLAAAGGAEFSGEVGGVIGSGIGFGMGLAFPPAEIGNFKSASDGNGGTLIYDPPLVANTGTSSIAVHNGNEVDQKWSANHALLVNYLAALPDTKGYGSNLALANDQSEHNSFVGVSPPVENRHHP
jgi:hypothetical protein